MNLQQVNLLNPKAHIKSPQQARYFIFSSIVIVLVYKFWKYLILAKFQIDPTNNYYLFEFLSTLFRIAGTGLGIWLIGRSLMGYNHLFKIGNNTLFAINILIIIPLYFVFRSSYFEFEVRLIPFLYEVFFNFFTGTFEEVMFRGLLFTSMAYFKGIAPAAVLSSIAFSLWHLDVTTQFSNLLPIFIFGTFACYCFYLGASILSLSIFHFLWDQVHFGIAWTSAKSNPETLSTYLCIYSAMALFCIWNYARWAEKKVLH